MPVPGHGDDRRLGGGDGVQRLELAAGQFEPAAEVGVRLRVDGGQRDVPVADANAVHRQAARLDDELDGVEQHPEHRGEETGGVGDRAGRGRDRVAEREVRRAGRRRHRPLAAYVARGPPARGRAKVAVHLRDGDPGEGGDLAVQGCGRGPGRGDRVDLAVTGVRSDPDAGGVHILAADGDHGGAEDLPGRLCGVLPESVPRSGAGRVPGHRRIKGFDAGRHNSPPLARRRSPAVLIASSVRTQGPGRTRRSTAGRRARPGPRPGPPATPLR
jgi:hypothetical protein